MLSRKDVCKRFSLIIKRIFDLVIGIISLIILLPIFIVSAVLIKIDSEGPVFFLQERVGKDGKMFKIFKFRTMVVNAETKGLGYAVEKNDSRITRVGKILRSTGIDELPQLINVVKGGMSLVGPRPTLYYQVKEYNDYQKRRLEMKPGITSLMIISGHNKLSWPEKIDTDIYYIDYWSLWLDIKIIIKTFWVIIFTREGIYEENPKTELPKNIDNE